MPPWVYALLAALGAAGVVGLKVGAWWTGRAARKREARIHADLAAAEHGRDVARGEFEVASAELVALTDHTDRQAAAVEVAEELRHATPASLDPDARRAALHASVRAHAAGRGPAPRSGDNAAVRPPSATGTGGDDDAR